MSSDKAAHMVDLHVGDRIRTRRMLRNMSQKELATALGLTFQQVQKYERGSNRVSASKLFEIANTLRAPIAYFFVGLEGNEDNDIFLESASEKALNAFLLTREGLELMQSFSKIRGMKYRRKILELVLLLADGD